MPPFRPRRTLRPIRPRLPRRAIPWYLAAIGLALVTGLLVSATLRRAADAEAAYGSTRPVAVMTRAVEAGTVIEAVDVALRPWPTGLAPPAAESSSPVGRTALVDLELGEVVLAPRLSGPEARGAAALLAPGQRAVAVPVTIPGLPLRPGDQVDLLAGGAAGGGPAGDLPVGGARPDVVAAGATVLEATEETVVVAVDAPAAAAVAAALTAGPVLLALRPPGP